MSFPVAVPGVRLGDSTPALHTDRCHSLSSLSPPPAAVASLPVLDDGITTHECVNIGIKKLCIPRGIHSFGSCKYVFKNHKDGRDCQTGANMGNQSHTGGYTGIPSQCTGDDNRAQSQRHREGANGTGRKGIR